MTDWMTFSVVGLPVLSVAVSHRDKSRCECRVHLTHLLGGTRLQKCLR